MAKIISFQGLPGAYSDLVCRKFYGNHKTLPCSTFEQTLSAVENEQAETALIPVENNLAGRVADMHFLLEKISLKIVAEHYHKIEHHLLAKKNSKWRSKCLTAKKPRLVVFFILVATRAPSQKWS